MKKYIIKRVDTGTTREFKTAKEAIGYQNYLIKVCKIWAICL